MLIVQLTGGLGNQMFQYAYAKARSLDLGVELKLDLNFYKSYEWHSFSLNPFNIDNKIATEEEINSIVTLDNTNTGKIQHRLLGYPLHTVSEEKLPYNSKYLKLRKHSYIKGYWQSENYFTKYKDIILQQFVIKIPPSPINASAIEEISSIPNSVSVHIRRGNYVNIDFVNKIHGTTSLDYYDTAINYFKKEFHDIKLFVFSDDIEWVKENLKTSIPTFYIDFNNDNTDYEDLRLMSLCKHNIIANSTFSWWGAYLNKNPNKVVFAPKVWFADPEKNAEAGDIIPYPWKRL